jgi:hypothetical protein
MWHDWKRNAYKVSVGNTERTRPLGRLRRRWKYNIRSEL